MKTPLPFLFALVVSPALADETRQLDAHEHGTGALNIAVSGTTVAMELRAPGADIVGFEYAAKSAEDRAAIDEAVAKLARPMALFGLPEAAACSVTAARAALESEEDHDEHDHAGEDKHDDHDPNDHAAESAHSEFHAEYVMICATPEALTEITFAYFEQFKNAETLEVQIATETGARAADVTRDAPMLDLRGMF
ncbi:MAG: DUF2796 domain-containing protein [Arenibacterium sp.]